MTTKHLLSLLTRHEDLRTPANLRRMAQRIAVEFVGMQFNPKQVERFLEIVPHALRPAIAEQVVMHAQRECHTRSLPEPKGGVSCRIQRVISRIEKNAKDAQDIFDAGLDASHPQEAESDKTPLRRRA